MGLDRWGIILFWVGAMALIALVWRRGRPAGQRTRWHEAVLLFTGISGMIAGLALIFLPDLG